MYNEGQVPPVFDEIIDRRFGKPRRDVEHVGRCDVLNDLLLWRGVRLDFSGRVACAAHGCKVARCRTASP